MLISSSSDMLFLDWVSYNWTIFKCLCDASIENGYTSKRHAIKYNKSNSIKNCVSWCTPNYSTECLVIYRLRYINQEAVRSSIQPTLDEPKSKITMSPFFVVHLATKWRFSLILTLAVFMIYPLKIIQN